MKSWLTSLIKPVFHGSIVTINCGVETKMAELLVVRSKIKEQTQMNVAGDFADALSSRVAQMIKEAERRCKENGRKTLKPCDI